MPPKPAHNVKTPDNHNNAIVIDFSKCLGCSMCTTKCCYGVLEKQGPKIPPFIKPNRKDVTVDNTDTTRVLIEETDCVGCGQCSNVCNFGAITPVDHITRTFEAKAAGKKLVAMIAPATRIGIAEAFGLPMGSQALHQLVHCLRLVGFDYVFDINSAADKTTMDDLEEVVELKKEGKGPAITSCCPGWMEYLEKKYPELIPHVSTARSPIACLASLVKNAWAKDVGLAKEDVYTVGIMPCVAKKVESQRANLHQDYDAAITTNEIAAYFKKNLPAEELKFTEEKEAALSKTDDGQCDLPFRRISGGSNIFAKSAGVAETVLRVLVKDAGEKWDPSKIVAEEMFKDAASGSAMNKLTIKIGESTIVGVICHGGHAIHKACEMMKNNEMQGVDVVEMMVCVNGCQCGGGQPKIPPAKKNDVVKRTAELDRLDHETDIAVASENTDVLGWIDAHMNKHEQHELLHTSFQARYQ
ncbi:iron-dependent hydrogenase, putative [Entamoeba invadens IP1]|uniref:iron-dependent hydrogenase, putative n=1 Tax=Entamoeba invadens IP1 TaxID=370355 RepID=UPI0002C3E3E0|nr:iron-dependent hydrogenase, putative [Entamoeba invadens IP1]ELP93041.1 iron-dependent hydrogenase, putative [Entamoeba invadens IP1]|eukprot:XP_004259812.1 iron-dependent hydrogenase, putative [Entamoeba invadens IP1]